LFERPASTNRALLVQFDFGDGHAGDKLAEFEELARSAGAEIAGCVTGKRQRPDPSLFAGRGKVAELAVLREQTGADLVIFNHTLSGAQERNLERELACRTIDRVSLILDIFAQRARSAEGKLQVELAQLSHLATRLVRGWTHLERQKGGIGLRGPGETQLETDRRLLNDRVRLLRERLRAVERQRATQRRARHRRDTKTVALVGYTNAGKSTLFNRLTRAKAYAADQLFATLDTTLRRVFAPNAEKIVLSDTVGFIRDLPHELVAAFRATLKEAAEADLLLHVIDSSHADREQQIASVEAVLEEIDAAAIPRVSAYNKIDLSGLEPAVARDEYGKIRAVWLSAATGAGCDLIRNLLAETFPAAARQNERDDEVAI
jgi:GTP-binding protein HflX